MPTFEESLARLQEIVDQLEDGRLPLADSLAAYEEGVKHLKVCYQALTDSERKIEILSGFDAAGNPITRPFDDAATIDQEKPAKRSPATPGATAASPRGAGPSGTSTRDIDDSRELF